MTEQEKQAARIAEQIINERGHLMLRDSLNAALTEEEIASPQRLAYVASVIEQVDARLKEAGIAPDERTTKEAVFYGLETFDNWEPTEAAARDAATHTCLMLGVIDEAEAERSSTQYPPSADPELHAEERAIEQAETIGIAQAEPSDAEATRHAMTGEEPQRPARDGLSFLVHAANRTLTEIKAERAGNGSKEASDRAARDFAAANRSGHGPDLGR